jgi:hypothetical protein
MTTEMEITEKQRQWQEKHDAEQAAFVRKMNDFFFFWRACGNKACRRARACCGEEPALCLMRNWRPLPETDRVWMRALAMAAFDGHVGPTGVDIADAALERYVALRDEGLRGGGGGS